MINHIENIVIGKPIVPIETMFAINKEDWEKNEKEKTLFTETRFLPKVLVEANIVPSINEVKRNKPQFMKELTTLDFIEIKWGKKKVFILVGE